MLLLLLAVALPVSAQQGIPLITVTTGDNGGQSYSVTIQILLLMTVLSLPPAALITMTSFTRVLVVFAILRQALGTAQTPSDQILVGLALFTSLFIMTPVFEKATPTALHPISVSNWVSTKPQSRRYNLFASLCSIRFGRTM